MISEVCLRVSVILFLGSDEPCDLRRYSRSRVLSCSERTSSATCLCTPAARSCSSSCDGGTFSSPANWATLVWAMGQTSRSEEHTSELQSRSDLVCRLL